MKSGQSWFARLRAFFSKLPNADFKWPPRHADLILATHRHDQQNPLPLARGETITLQRGPGGYEVIKSGQAFTAAGTRVHHEEERPADFSRSTQARPRYARSPGGLS